jgi:hypothetical protein
MRSFISALIVSVSSLMLSLPVNASNGFDGPAELPRVTVPSSLASTPAHGSIISVRAGGDLQAALNNAFCGDTIELQAGATFTGNFHFPAKNCDSGHWIIVRTSSNDSLLPAEGHRASPCYAGVSSLPGRPKFGCSGGQNVMARLVNDTTASGPVVLLDKANHYRLVGLEITRTAGTKNAPNLIFVQSQGTADHIIVDRCWLHGTTHDDTAVGVATAGTTNVAVVDSYFSDFHCTANGLCTDAHAIGGGTGTHQDGPFKISDNFLEASGEAVMFGGGRANFTPADIQIDHNHFFKPWQWMPGNANLVRGIGGRPFVTKNHMELKNAMRVLVEANLMENNWGGFSQSGHGLVLSPKNQHSDQGNVCPNCQVVDVTIRYLRMSHAGAGLSLATSISGDGKNGAQALAGKRWSIHDVVLDDINRKYQGSGTLFTVLNGWNKNPLNTVTINHVTGFPDSDAVLLSLGNKNNNPDMYGFVFTNNIVITGRYPVWSANGGGDACATSGTPAQKIAHCFTTNNFKSNALVATPDAFPPSSWPTGNFFPADPQSVGFVQYGNGVDGDYRLQAGSKYKNAGTDGHDLGADIAGLNAALAGVD